MAYIDKDKALNLDFRINVSLFESRRKAAERAVQAYADAINAIPAADVRPVVKAKWNVGADGWECSNCTIEANNTYPICPYCGAEMEES